MHVIFFLGVRGNSIVTFFTKGKQTRTHSSWIDVPSPCHRLPTNQKHHVPKSVRRLQQHLLSLLCCSQRRLLKLSYEITIPYQLMSQRPSALMQLKKYHRAWRRWFTPLLMSSLPRFLMDYHLYAISNIVLTWFWMLLFPTNPIIVWVHRSMMNYDAKSRSYYRKVMYMWVSALQQFQPFWFQKKMVCGECVLTAALLIR